MVGRSFHPLHPIEAAKPTDNSSNMAKQLVHPFDSNKNESLNKSMTMYAPKDRSFGSTKQLEYRVHLCVGVDSIGNKAFLSKATANLCPPTASQQLFFDYLDGVRQKKKAYHMKPEQIKKRRADKEEKWSRHMAEEKRASEAGLDYGSGIATRPEKMPKMDATGDKKCSRCGGKDHQRSNSKKCPFNKSYGKSDHCHNKSDQCHGVAPTMGIK